MAQFFADENVEIPVYLTIEQAKMFDSWISLSAQQKEAVEKIIESYKTTNNSNKN